MCRGHESIWEWIMPMSIGAPSPKAAGNPPAPAVSLMCRDWDMEEAP